MRNRLTLLAAAGAILCGCQSGGNQSLLERELRLQEDKLYHMQAMLNDCQASLESSHRENEALKRELTTGDRVPNAEPAPPSGRNPIRTPPAPPRTNPLPRMDGPTLQPPNVELPTIPGEPNPLPSPAMPTPTPGSASSALGEKVAKIVLNPRLTGGLNHDGRPGDEGILVAFEPRDAAGKSVQTPGDVSVVLLDPAKQGPEARVARWDFSTHEVALHFRKTPLEHGLHFELPWPSDPPTNSRLQLFVRYTTATGEKLQADRTIDVSPPAAPAPHRWTRAAANSHAAVPAANDSTAAGAVPGKLPRESSAPPWTGGSTATAETRSDVPVAREAALPRRENIGSGRPTWSPYR